MGTGSEERPQFTSLYEGKGSSMNGEAAKVRLSEWRENRKTGQDSESRKRGKAAI